MDARAETVTRGIPRQVCGQDEEHGVLLGHKQPVS